MLFDVVVQLNPTKNEEDDGAIPEIVWEGRISAKNDVSAAFIAGGKIMSASSVKGKTEKDMARLEVVLRPFRG